MSSKLNFNSIYFIQKKRIFAEPWAEFFVSKRSE